jgi:serine/threonine-protein kinase HSL1 (negative regulator of Swe1 kinase)
MAERYRGNRSVPERLPLSVLPNGANSSPITRAPFKQTKAPTTSPNSLPHNESLTANGSLTIRDEQPNSPEHNRIRQITGDKERDSKRNSAISTASTTASGRKRKAYIGHWQLGKTIGKGGCSRVRAVRHKYTRQYGAVKIIARSTAESTRAQSLANLIESSKLNPSPNGTGYKPIPYGLEREIAVMKLLEHDNIVRLFDVWENSNELYLIMEYVEGGELFHYVEQRKGLHEDETIIIFRQIIAALLYCHRMHICHRDLKPENILLDPSKMTVKLIDFGMAALQADGKMLSTPCGSPHYAAPEVVSSKPYDGKQADVWSCGVILYVMLTGTTPYNYGQEGDIRILFRDIAKAKYYMPNELSHEAKDLIRRIFVPDPKRRITMDEVWDHPLLHKYDAQFGYDGPEGSKEAAIGPTPKLEDWTIKRSSDVDREILRNMRTLWHSEAESSLLHKLTNRDINQEKVFYAALMKHREENLENYEGDTESMGYSASDYHHSQPPKSSDIPPLPLDSQHRSQSQYSILNDEHLRPSHSFIEPPPSISSYDPYRASRDPIVHRGEREEFVSVIVHRNYSSSTRKASNARSLRHPNSLRVEMLKQGNRGSSNYSNSSLTRSGRSRSSMRRSSMSKHSLTSSAWPSSPPVIATMRPSDVHRRGVSFGHVRRTSTTSALTSQDSTQIDTPATPQLPDSIQDRRTLKMAGSSNMPTPSPTAHLQQMVRSRKDKALALETPRIKVRKAADTPTQHMRSEIRKHSVELEKACQEAFFRDSAGSSLTAKTSISEKASPYDTPPSSVSRKSIVLDKLPSLPSTRPLPELPKDTPNSYLQRTLGEAREKLAAYRAGGEDNTARFDEVMKMLETILPEASTPERRLVSAPEARTPDHLGGYMPIISEESDNNRSSRDGTGNWRSVTAPSTLDRRNEKRQAKLPEDKTIRMVASSSPAAVAPLNVRKRSNGSDEALHAAPQRLTLRPSHERLEKKRSIVPVAALEPIEEDSILASPSVVRKKRSGWFGRARRTPEPELVAAGSESPAATTKLGDSSSKRSSYVLSRLQKPLPQDPPASALSSEFPIRKKRFAGGKKGFSKWLGMKGVDKNDEGDTTGKSLSEPPRCPEIDTNFVATVMTNGGNTSLDSLFSSTSGAPSLNGPSGHMSSSGAERSWFSRFLNIKPATKLLCFSIPRGRARTELVLLLKEWQRHGVRDLEYSREHNTIYARIDKNNSLDIKPVAFKIELFVVLEHGVKVGMSIARFVQVKGAASGFRTVLEVLDGVVRKNKWLVEDEEKVKALCEVVGS